jgi:hypothetical protein
MSASLSDLLTALQNGVTAMNALNITIGRVFPGATAVSTTAPSSVGAITFTSSQTKGFITVTTSSGFSAKMALY